MKMRYFKYTIPLFSLIVVSCLGGKKNSDTDVVNEETAINSVESKSKIDIHKIKKNICETFPKELVLIIK